MTRYDTGHKGCARENLLWLVFAGEDKSETRRENDGSLAVMMGNKDKEKGKRVGGKRYESCIRPCLTGC